MTRAQNKKFYLGGRAKINKSKVTVYVGQSTVLKVSGTKKKANWKTSNNKVATVKNGKVTAKKSGTAVITAKVGSKKYTCKVTVKNPSEKTVVMKVDKEVINDKEVASITNTYLKQLTIKSKKTSGRYVEYTVTKSSYDKMMAGIKNDFNSRVNKFIKQQDVVKKVAANDKLIAFTIYIDQKKLEELNKDMEDMDDNSQSRYP